MAEFNVANFRSQMVGDGARPNLFSCTIPDLTVNVNGETGSEVAFNFMCRAAQLPGSSVNAVPVNYFGRELKFSGNRIFSEWTVIIINDEDFKVRNTFEKWMSSLNSHVSNLRNLVSPLSYQKDGYVTQYGKAGNVIKEYKFVGLFPTDVSPIELDWSANDSIEEFSVTFAYQWWESTNPSSRSTTDTTQAGPSASLGFV
jgi:hypothetical protein